MLLVALANTVAADSDCGLQPASTLTGASYCPWAASRECHVKEHASQKFQESSKLPLTFFFTVNQQRHQLQTTNFLFLTTQNS